MYTIYSKDGNVLKEVVADDSSLFRREVMGDSYVQLNFNLPDYISFPKGSYIDYKNFRLQVIDNMYPSYNEETGGWNYQLRFEPQQGLLKKYNVFYTGQGYKEAEFVLTTYLAEFGKLIAGCMNDALGSTDWSVKAIPASLATMTRTVSFRGDKLWDALGAIAEAFECEWWTEENGEIVQICFGKLEVGTEENFEQGGVVSVMPTRPGDDTNYGTRFYVFGSTRNLTKDYGQAEQGGTTNHISEIRLRLPDNQPYIDAWENMEQEDVVEQVVFFDDIYPNNNDVVTSVEWVDRQLDDGTSFKAAVLYAADTPFTPDDIIEGETMALEFTSGALQGRTFEVIVNTNSFDKRFEIIPEVTTAGETKLIIPDKDTLAPEAGDTFVLTGIKLPEERILEAEEELLEAGKTWAAKNSKDTNLYDCPTNPVFCHLHDKNYDLGQRVLLIDPNRFGPSGRSSRIQAFEKKLCDEYEATYTVGDNAAYSKIGSIEADVQEAQYAQRLGIFQGIGIYLIRSRYDSTQPTDYNAYSALAADRRFLSRISQDTATEIISFAKGLKSPNYQGGNDAEGIMGAGFAITQDVSGSWVGEFDKIIVRREAHFNEAVINQISFTLGQTVFTRGGFVCSDVVEQEDRYRCLFDTKQGSVRSGLKVGDQVRCQRYSPGYQSLIKYYWRLVLAVGDDYAELSKSDADGTGVPEAGDNIVQFGHRTDVDRQSAIVIDPSGGGSVVVYAGIDSYDLTEKNYVGMGVDPATGEAYHYVYGDMFVGSRTLDPDEGYMTFQKPEGGSGKRLVVGGQLNIGADSTGLTNLSEWAGAAQDIEAAQSTANDALSKIAEEEQARVTGLAEVNRNISAIQNQIDGVVENWFYAYAPTTTNYPASAWTTEDEKRKHVGDTFTSISQSPAPDAGKSWRWIEDPVGAFVWSPIADSDAVKALQEAAIAQATADGKSTTYLIQPTSYSEGDTWILNADTVVGGVSYKMGDVLTANASSTAFVEAHWAKKLRYTDDTAAMQAQAAADSAQASADNANTALADMASDLKFTPAEKAAQRDVYNQMALDYATYEDSATTYGVSLTAVTTAYNNLRSYLTDIARINDTATTTTITTAQAATYDQYRSAWKTSVEGFANEISQKFVDNVQVGGVNLMRNTQHPDLTDTAVWNNNAGASVWGEVGEFTAVKVQGQWGRLWQIIDGGFKAGQSYAFSCMVRRDATLETMETLMNLYCVDANITIHRATLGGRVLGPSGTNGILGVALSADTFERLEVTFSSPANRGGNAFRVEFYTNNSSTNTPCGVVYGYKLETGNKATAWSAAPTDVKEDIDKAVDGIQVGSVNLIDDSELIAATSPTTITSYYVTRSLWLKPDTEYALSIDEITLLAGTPSRFQFGLFNQDINARLAEDIYLTTADRKGVFKTKSNFTAQQGVLVCYAGAWGSTAGNSVEYRKVTLVEGNKPAATWSPSLADQKAEVVNAIGEQMSEIDYLREAFKDFPATELHRGLVLTSMTALRKGGSGADKEQITGFINGGDNELPWQAFGIDTSYTNSDEFLEKAAQAKYRVERDGSSYMEDLHAKNSYFEGEIQAQKGTFGGDMIIQDGEEDRVRIMKGNITPLSAIAGTGQNNDYTTEQLQYSIGEQMVPGSQFTVSYDGTRCTIGKANSTSVGLRAYAQALSASSSDYTTIGVQLYLRASDGTQYAIASAVASAPYYGGALIHYEDAVIDKAFVLNAGDYAIWATVTSSGTGTTYALISPMAIHVEFSTTINRTEIGVNGFASIFGSNAYFWLGEQGGKFTARLIADWLFESQNRLHALRVSDTDGVQVGDRTLASQEYTWRKL